MGGHRLEPVIAFLRVAQAHALKALSEVPQGQVEEFENPTAERTQII